ncbi:MAG TPA: LuxR C-terminal-related transcriptional regulator [Dongiaceae bacterium]|nr:LuxR C-terminal-related transcriptional regulator [Dongiaceae bacterium]
MSKKEIKIQPVASARKVLHLCPPTIEQEALQQMLMARIPDVTVLSAFTVGEALELLQDQPDIDLLLFLDHAADFGGTSLVVGARTANPGIVVAVYGHLATVDTQRWIDVGCDGLIARDMIPARFVAAVEFVLGGNRYVSPELVAVGTGDDGCAFLATCGWGHPLLEKLPVGVLMIQGERIIYANKTATDITAHSTGELLRMRVGQLISEPHRPFMRERMELWHRGHPVDPLLVLAIKAGGVLRWISARQCQMSVAGTPTIVSTISDLTPHLGGAFTQQMLAMSPIDLIGLDFVPLLTGKPMAGMPAMSKLGVAETAGPLLTRRQHQVLEHLAVGATNKEIAKRLGISEATAKLHVHRTLRALGAVSRTEAASIARSTGLLS